MSEDKNHSRPEVIAYQVAPSAVRITPALLGRSWMDDTGDAYANRCLPLRIANQAGWFLLNDHPLDVVWDGSRGKKSLQILPLNKDGPVSAISHFGNGILTWHIPYLFRTPPHFNLLVRGPSNWPKDGIYPLEGLVEADWAIATFTMNWKCTRPNHTVRFEAGEPICMIVPQRRGELESFAPRLCDLEANEDLHRTYNTWRTSRQQFNDDLDLPGSEARRVGWQRDYFAGRSPSGVVDEHQVSLTLAPFSSAHAELPD